MNKLLGWIVGRTKVGKMSHTVQTALDGKKQTIVSLLAAITATGTIILNYTDKGLPYLMQVASTPEFAAASVGWIGFFNAMKGEKIRQENAVIIANQEQLKSEIEVVNYDGKPKS